MNTRQASLGFIFLTLLIDILGAGLIAPILPKLIQRLEGGDIATASSVYGILIAVYSVMQFVFAPILGSLSDRYGRRPVILMSLFGLGIDYLLLAFAPNLVFVVIGRIVAGIMGASVTAAIAYIADISPPEKRAENFGLVGAAFGLGFIVGPLLGGVLGNIDLRLPFLVAAGLALCNVLYGVFVLPESLRSEHRQPFSWRRANPVGALLALRRYPQVLGLTGSYVFINLALNGLISTWVLYTGYRFGWSIAQVGISLAVVGVASAVVQGGLVRVVVPKIGEARTAIVSLALAVITYTLYGFSSEAWMLYAIIPFNALAGLATPAIQGAISRNVPPQEQGVLQGALAGLNSLTNVIAPPLATGLFAYFIAANAPIVLPGAAFVLSAVLALVALGFAIVAFQQVPAPLHSPATGVAPDATD